MLTACTAVRCHAVLMCCALQLREASETDGKAARALVKLRLFRQFYVIVIVFIYFTRIMVYLLRSTLAYQHQWLADFISCLAYLALYVWVGYNFRPNADNPYTKVSQQEEIEMGL
jgi:NADH:ubiquinone oxidoreductase subunit 3 (subunit A)